MSGETIKLVKVEEIVLRQLRQHKSRVHSKTPDLSEQVNVAKKHRQLQQDLTSLEQRNQRLEQQTPQLKTSLASLEKNTSKRLRQQQQELQAALREAESRQQPVSRPSADQSLGFEQQRSENLKVKAAAQQEYNRLMQEQAQKFNQIVEQERSSRQQEQQVLQQQLEQVVGNIEQDKQRKQKLAQDLLADVQLIWQQIDRNYQHGRFAPDRLANLNRLLAMAQDNVGAGLYEAAIANAQQTYLALADLRLELEQKEQEWLLLYNAALGDVRSLLAEARASRQCEVEVGEGNEAEKFNLDVDYWTNGRLGQYEQQLNQIVETLQAASLQNNQSSLTTEQLKALTGRIAALQPTLGEIVEQARSVILSSQLRAEIADTVVEALASLGYTLVDPETDAAYEGDDQRQAYLVKVKNLAGDEVVTVINPEKEFGANSVSINAFSQSIVDETAAQQNAQAIFDHLESAGVKGIGPTQCNHQARAEYQNVEAVKQRRTAPASQPL